MMEPSIWLVQRKVYISKHTMDIKRHALFTHCYDHTLDLSYSDAVKGWKLSRLL